jgi:hypothetical protein
LYRDSRRTMCLYRLVNLQRADTQWPSLDGLLGIKKGGKIMQTKSGAKKAWATRKQNAHAKMLSERALKAWATRRKSLPKTPCIINYELTPAEKRERNKFVNRQRALKAWETRRSV